MFYVSKHVLKGEQLNRDKEEEFREQKEKDAVEQEKRSEECGGPWKVSESETSIPETKEVDPELLVENNPVIVEKKNTYVPPSLRNKSASSNAGPAPSRGGRRAAAPEIENTKEFPTLGAEPDGTVPEKQTAVAASGPNINVGNKFSALTSNH